MTFGIDGDLVPVEHGEHRVQVHVRPVLGHHHGDDPLRRALGEERSGDLLDHPGLGPLAQPDQDRPVADRLHVAALERGPAEVGRLEPAVVAQRGYQYSNSASANIGW